MRANQSLKIKSAMWNRSLLIAGIVFIAFNLRPAITSVGPLLDSIRSSLHLSNGFAGLITTLPLIAFALVSPVAPKLGSRFGNPFTILLGLVMLIVGIIVRSFGQTFSLLLGTIAVGIGIAICNVLLPSIVKQKFPDKVGLMTGVYTAAMGVVAAMGSGLSVPLAQGFRLGWQKTLLAWGILAVLAACIWFPITRVRETREVNEVTAGISLWRSTLAWQVSLFMGLQSFLFFCTITWLPGILGHAGIGATTAGWLVSSIQLIGLPASFLTPILADRFPNQKAIVLGLAVAYFAGLAGFLVGGNIALVALSTVLIGIGQGASISLALVLFSLRTDNSNEAAALSGMAQSVGYLLAAVGPVLIGALFDATHSWIPCILVLMSVAVLVAIFGVGAARNKYVAPDVGTKTSVLS